MILYVPSTFIFVIQLLHVLTYFVEHHIDVIRPVAQGVGAYAVPMHSIGNGAEGAIEKRRACCLMKEVDRSG
jgi:hypothetical protein